MDRQNIKKNQPTKEAEKLIKTQKTETPQGNLEKQYPFKLKYRREVMQKKKK